jgi:hypothetical protein
MAEPNSPYYHPEMPSAKPRTDDLRAVLLADFTATRAEITTLLALQGQFLNISVVLLSLCIAAATRPELAYYLMPYAPMGAIPFVILGLLYGDCSARIMRAARYIHLELRPELLKLAGPFPAWEQYIRERSGSRKLMLLDYLRWTLFLVPAGWFTWFGFIREQWVWASVDVALIVFCLGVLLYVFRRLSRRVLGL